MDLGSVYNIATFFSRKPTAVLPAKPFVRLGCVLSVDEGKQVHAVGGLSLGHLQTGRGHQGGKNVGARDHFPIDLSDRGMLGPANDQRDAHTAFENIELMPPERLVVGVISGVTRI